METQASHFTFTGTTIEIVLKTGEVIATVSARYLDSYPYFAALFNEEIF
jgi:hypothetical protein